MPDKDTLLIVDDETDLLVGLQRTIAMEIDCRVLTADNGPKALDILKSTPIDLMLADIRMPDMSGMELFEQTRQIDPLVTVIMMTAYGSIEQAVQAIKQGAYDFIRKPVNENHLLHLIRKGLERNRLLRENDRLLKKLRNGGMFQNMIGRSNAMEKVFKTVQMLAATGITVLVTGESGTGKELVCRAIHALSKRGNRPMVTVNCPALPENILESELFGYRKGAFTHAMADKKGLFEVADGSTILLDEIGDLTPALQTKLLRVLQEKEIKPLGDSKTRQVDVRIVASTNRDLKQKMEEGTFREDLYYRLNVATLHLPPLRERTSDIPLLVHHFLKKSALELEVPAKKLTPGVMDRFARRAWPGNVRELENAIRSITALVPAPKIGIEDLPETIASGPENTASPFAGFQVNISRPYKDLKEQILEDFTRSYVTTLLEETHGNITLAAEASGIQRQSLQKIIKRHGIQAEDFRS